ncbi:MAG: IS4 family transposase [Steroidobacteraceae bacterium]
MIARTGPRCEDPEVQAILDAGIEAGPAVWVYEELAGVDLLDKRLDRRLIRTAGFLAGSPAAPINQACPDWGSAKAAYRLFDNPKATPEAIREPHIRATVKRMAVADEPLLAVQDTVFVSYKDHPKVRGVGPIGMEDEGRGLIMHNALVFTSSGVALGLLSQNIWARQEVAREGRQQKIERLQHTVIEEKESSKWLRALRETVERAPPKAKVITVADRESDVFEFLTCAEELKASYLIRARIDRQLVPEESEGFECMEEALAAAEVLGRMDVQVTGNDKRKARTATVAVKVAEVAIKPPQRRGRSKDSGSSESITVRVVGATERKPPEGEKAISWVLLTNLRVADCDAAAEKVRWYGKRFNIETWHKVLKSGCTVEECRLETGERLARYLALFSVIGVRLMHVAYLARVQPELPATAVFSEEEIEALHLQVRKERPPQAPPTLKEAVRMLGRLGGHLGRKSDGEPGMTVVWRGWMRLYDAVLVIGVLRNVGMINSS